MKTEWGAPLCGAILAAYSVHAMPAPDGTTTASTDSALPAVQTQGGVPYLSGGVGADESAAIRAATARYALAVTLSAVEDGHAVFLASAPVTVTDASGIAVLDVTTDGPYLLADLPPGRYRIRARCRDQERDAEATLVPGKTAQVSLIWK
ncbi:carboxypeptidase-like regulatory domain-containing protein [Solimonas marina]|uniref:Carboxypeptidase regulatory-like domain-containing protein n=1 Tax=Solimonas marina TaxID=2714601 RepID=A0A970B4Z0_9GAMM|nr:carboxypeptidase-like regulatory domain-containing protein [Solimonas marina]NKF21020.1 carboxypeptidase regulatory-like domain-containing protein [Solimonas marina]